MTSGFFQRPDRRAHRPRCQPGERVVEVSCTVPESVLLVWEREAEAESVSRAYLQFEGTERLVRLMYEAREQGLVPVPARITTEQLELIGLVAKSQGLTVDQWTNHVLMNAAASPAWDGEQPINPEKISEKAAV